jgi:hypothetical protein
MKRPLSLPDAPQHLFFFVQEAQQPPQYTLIASFHDSGTKEGVAGEGAHDVSSNILEFINSLVVTLALPVLTFLGVQKFIFEPRYEAWLNRRKYATALYLACTELKLHLASTAERMSTEDSGVPNAIKKIPDHDFHGNAAWFTKEGYYATITAYKIAAVSAWLRVYQNALLFSSYTQSQAFLRELYEKAQQLKVAFSTRTCLWYYYLDALGERLIVQGQTESGVLSFSRFCAEYASNGDFRKFFEQLHMYLWFVGDRNPRYLATLPEIQESLDELIKLLEKKNLLTGFRIERTPASARELDELPNPSARR